MANIINAITTGTGGISTTADASGSIQIQTNNGTAAMTIDTSQNVGIGVTSPGNLLHVYRNNTGNAAQVQVEQAGSGSATLGFLKTGVYAWMTGQYTDNSYRIAASGTDLNTNARLIIDTNGAFGLNGANYGTANQVLTSNGPGAAVSWKSVAGGFSNMTVFTSPGTFTTPASTTQIKVTVVGGGGGGGGGGTVPAFAGAGGGGGGAIYVGPVTASTGYSVTVGTGGAGGASANGSAGNTSSFGVLASATGGSGGTTPVASGGATSGGGAGSAGTLQFNGGVGIAQGSANVNGQASGGSFLGGSVSGLTSGAGATGGKYGGGGIGNSASAPGGAGAAGVVIVEY